MPIYEFACNKCGKVFEDLVRGNLKTQCPACGSQDTQKLMSTCARRPRGGTDDLSASASGGGCGSCMGGNCASCGH